MIWYLKILLSSPKKYVCVETVLLKTKGIDIKKTPKTDDKLTPIEIAEKEGHTATAELLKNYSTPKKGVLSRLFGRGGTTKNKKRNRITKKNRRLV